MKINSINTIFPDLLKTEQPKQPGNIEFDNIFSGLIQDVNKAQLESGKISQDYITGGNVELHEVMIAGEKAKTSLELLIEIRNKAIDMYKELTRMQV